MKLKYHFIGILVFIKKVIFYIFGHKKRETNRSLVSLLNILKVECHYTKFY